MMTIINQLNNFFIPALEKQIPTLIYENVASTTA